MSGGRGISSPTSTAMRLPLTTTLPLATGRSLARMLTASSSDDFQFDDGAAAEPEHLVDRHGGGAEHHGDIDRNLIDCGHV